MITLTYETPDGDERTVRAEATNTTVTELARDDPAAGNVAFWYCDLKKVENDGDSVPYVVVPAVRTKRTDSPSPRPHTGVRDDHQD